MLKIGDFSKLSQVTVKALRHYERLGLLKPAHVDLSTGYRYYSADQLPSLNRILALKDLGLALEEIAELLHGDLPAEQLRGMLRLKRTELRSQIETERARLARVEARLLWIEKENQPPMYDVILKAVPEQQAASIRETIADHPAVGELFHYLAAYLCRRGIPKTAPPMCIYHDPEYRAQDVDVQVAFPVGEPVEEDDRITNVLLPPIEQAASLLHSGPHDSIGEAYGALMTWIEANGYRPAGPSRLVYIRTPEADPEAAVPMVEVQLPVQKTD